mmetsp:Transcript_34603/g.72016  ORF Transcript_34603/g.72016 Transcript_34603/m.72016 type:complete len:262 (-) Transcript_34603:177-962(-)|eukprot:CAMPEP_0172445336 /NCGR_PEP_ID=MMETSP1065-20121228/5174_1 /TAXON_ID=265537 /ORGANISM="Amphiprora paludosa, Strain CCMP125" /LENGTH=261 /DNA_ID=CAMNT_0013196135 /DNA_START=95 /DNA_END=880 /DNA_ORIENTATION=+
MVEAMHKRSCPLGATVVSRKRRCTDRAVRFSTSYTERTAKNFFDGLDETQEKELRTQLWYTPRDSEQFMQERLQTVRFLRAVQGNATLIEPVYCARGYENFESTSVSSDLQRLRLQHVRTVLSLQKQGASVPQIAEAALSQSNFALQRALRFAQKDAVEAQAVQRGEDQSEPSLPKQELPTTAAFSLRHNMMPKSFSASAASRQSLAQFSLLRRRRATVDISKLKQMNRQFLQGLGGAPPACRGSTTLDLLNEALSATATE